MTSSHSDLGHPDMPADTITLTVDGRRIEVPQGASVLDAINASGIYVPQLCKDPDMKPIGACRTCLVQIDGTRGFPASCSVPAAQGASVWTDTPEVRTVRSGVIELTMAMLPVDSGVVEPAKEYRELTTAAVHHGLSSSRWSGREREPADTSSPVFNIAMDACILCGRCAKACQDGAQFIGAIDVLGVGTNGRIGTFMDRPLIESVCTTCGQCLSVCPTGAIEVKTPVANVVKSITTTCPYCGVGCGVKAQVDDTDRIIQMLDDPDNRSSVGMLCVKGRFGYTFVHHEDRLTTPLVRKDGKLAPVSWDEALDYVVDRLLEYRGDSFATLCSAKATNEDGYIQQKFARLLMQSNHIDHCTRLCHAPSVEAMLTALGSGATSNSYVDYEEAGCLLIIGSDANSNHPVAASRMRRAVIERGARLIVINPRRIEMCDFADLWLRPRPGTDVALLNAIAKVVLDEGLLDEKFVDARTEGFDEWRQVVDRYDPAYAEKITGVPAEDIARAARMYARPPFSGSCLIWGMGITQHTNGTPNAHSLLNLALLTGQLGRPGSGISPLRGQNNVQGCGDAGCLPDAFTGYQTISADTVSKFSKAWSNATLPSEKGLVVTDMMEEIVNGRLKAMYVTGENPLLSEPDLHRAEEAFRRLEFLVVQDIFMHETAEVADVVLPGNQLRREGRNVHEQREAGPESPQGCGANRSEQARLGDHRGPGTPDEPPTRAGSRARVQLCPSLGDMGRDGGAHARTIRYLLRQARQRGRYPVAVPRSGPPWNQIPLRARLPERAEGKVRAVRPGPAGGGASLEAVPAHPEHRSDTLPLARGHHHPPVHRSAGALAGGRDRDQPRGRRALRRRGRRVGPARLPPGRAGGARRIHRQDACRGGVRALREAQGACRQLSDQLGLRP